MKKLAMVGMLLGAMVAGCSKSPTSSVPAVTVNPSFGKPGEPLKRVGDEIMVCGQLFHTGAPVVLWCDPGGYNAYSTERRFTPLENASFLATTKEMADAKAAGKQISTDIKSPDRYNLRYTKPATMPVTQPVTQPSAVGMSFVMDDKKLEEIRSGWKLEDLQNRLDQFVYHYDVAGTSKVCFKVLQDMRGLSVHFMLDIDGTIYQTLDLRERAFHATTSNTRSVGIEIANMGAYASRTANPMMEWYPKDSNGQVMLKVPARYGESGLRDKTTILRPARPEMITGVVQGRTYHQYDLTPQQYDSLTKLTATLCTVFPKMKCDYPRDAEGKVILKALPAEQLATYGGLLGHFHVQSNKQDPGPAFDWDKVINGARALMKGK